MAFNVKFYQGTQEAYDALAVKEPKSFYLLDGVNLYLGALKLTSDADVQQILTTLASHAITFEDLYAQLESIKTGSGGTGGGSSSDIEALEKEIEDIKTSISTHNQQFDEYKTGMDLSYTTLSDSVAGINITISEMQGSILTNSLDIEEKYKEINTTLGEYLKNIEAIEQKQLQQDILIEEAKGNADLALVDIGDISAKVTTLIADDENMSVREIAAFEVAKVISEADARFDTLKEIADWILNDTAGVTDLNSKILICEQDIATLQTTITTLQTKVTELETAVSTINDDTNGILAQSKLYAEEVAQTAQENAEKNASDELKDYRIDTDSKIAQVESAIEVLQQAMLGGGGGDGSGVSTEIIKNMIDSSILDLGLGTAAQANVEDFDAAGSANSALTQAKSYSDSNKQEVVAYIESLLNWGHIPTM